VPETNHPAPTIRYAVERDGGGIARLYQHTTRVAYRGYVPDAVLDTRSLHNLTQLWTSRINQPPGKQQRIFVADPPPSQRPPDPASITDIAGFVAIGAATSSPETPDTGEIHKWGFSPPEATPGRQAVVR
jgi:hypothetical protein